jgi:hypothetical protein
VFLLLYRSRRLKPIIVDPGLYLSEKTGMFYASQKRDLPNAFRLFTGVALSYTLGNCLSTFSRLV